MPVADVDATLVERIRGGDETAFEELMRRYEGKVYRLAMGMMKNPEDALEVVQDAFLSVHQKLGSFKGESAFSTWLYKVALNAAYMKLRSRSRHEKVESLESLDGYFDTRGRLQAAIRDWSEGADDVVYRKEVAAVLRDAMAKLPEEYRAVFALRDLEELSNQEVAEITGLTVGATKTRLHRARLFLRERLARLFQGRPQ